MVELFRIGENAIHDRTFEVNRPNGHPVYLLLFVKTNATFYIDENWITIPPNTAFLFKPEQTHRYKAIENSYIDSWAHLTFHDSLLSGHFPFGKPIALHNINDYDTLFHIICNEFYGSKPHRSSILNSLLTALLEKLADESNTTEYPEIYYQLSKIRTKIYSHPELDYSIESIATDLSISSGYLHALYKRFFHTSCIQDIIKSRTQLASEYLRSSNLSIENIAQKCGYHHTEHFIRQFKKELGMTPNKYRKNTISKRRG